MIPYRFVPISSQKGVLFFETPGSIYLLICECFPHGPLERNFHGLMGLACLNDQNIMKFFSIFTQ